MTVKCHCVYISLEVSKDRMETTMHTIRELATATKLSRKTLWAWVRDGHLKSTRYGKRLHRITEKDWNDFIGRSNGRKEVEV